VADPRAGRPEELTGLFVERANDGDAAGVAALYEEQAVMAYPPGGQTVGREAIRALWEKVLAAGPHFEPEEPLPALVCGDIALTATVAKDGAGARAERMLVPQRIPKSERGSPLARLATSVADGQTGASTCLQGQARAAPGVLAAGPYRTGRSAQSVT
jgi:hypothetical protein